MDQKNTFKQDLVEKEKEGLKPTFGVVGSSTAGEKPSSPELANNLSSAATGSTRVAVKSSQVSEVAPSSQSRASSPTLSSNGSILSRRSTNSSATTVSDMDNDPVDDLVLGCPFNFNGCPLRYPAIEFNSWCAHSILHFGGRPLPTFTRCVFCDQEFRNSNAMIAWQDKMRHLADHLIEGLRLEQDCRPDFALYHHLLHHGIINKAQYDIFELRLNERPGLKGFREGFRDRSYEPESRQLQRERESRIVVREERRREGHSTGSGRRRPGRLHNVT